MGRGRVPPRRTGGHLPAVSEAVTGARLAKRKGRSSPAHTWVFVKWRREIFAVG